MNDFTEIMKNPPTEELDVITIICQDCGKEFQLTPAEQKFYKAKGYSLPKRCPECREKKHNNIIKIKCVDCGKEFELDGYQQEYFAKKGQVLPKRCRACRDLKRMRNEEVRNVEETAEEPML